MQIGLDEVAVDTAPCGHAHHFGRIIQPVDHRKTVAGEVLPRQAGATPHIEHRALPVRHMPRKQTSHRGGRQVVEPVQHGLVVGLGPVAVQGARLLVTFQRIGALQQLGCFHADALGNLLVGAAHKRSVWLATECRLPGFPRKGTRYIVQRDTQHHDMRSTTA